MNTTYQGADGFRFPPSVLTVADGTPSPATIGQRKHPDAGPFLVQLKAHGCPETSALVYCRSQRVAYRAARRHAFHVWGKPRNISHSTIFLVVP